MKITVTKHDKLDLIEVENDKSLKLSLTDLGAGSYKIESHGAIVNYGPKDLDDYAKPNFYFGKTIGRFAGRIKGATWNGINWKPNENGNLLHSGPQGVHDKRFKYRTQECKDYAKVVFSIVDSGKKSLFPGKFTLKVIYKIYKNIDKIELTFKTVCTEDCIVNLTNHAYYCLGSASLDDLKMKINLESLTNSK